MSVVDGRADGDLTLAFTLDAMERLADPNAVFTDAREWSRHVGIVDDDRERITTFLESNRIDHDYDLGDMDRWLALESIRNATETPRHVYVGLNYEDRRVADHIGWEFVHLEEAAEKAGWSVEPTNGNTHLFSRLRNRLPFGSK